jgi:hypothetical protein
VAGITRFGDDRDALKLTGCAAHDGYLVCQSRIKAAN